MFDVNKYHKNMWHRDSETDTQNPMLSIAPLTLADHSTDCFCYNTEFSIHVSLTGRLQILNGAVYHETWDGVGRGCIAKFSNAGEAVLAMLKAGFRYDGSFPDGNRRLIQLVKFV